MTAEERQASLVRRFWKYVRRGVGDECWGWLGATDSNGYGLLSIRHATPERAHVISFQIHHGAIPPGLHVLHSCDNPPCPNPAHLFSGTPSDNMVDMVRKGRHGLAKLDAEKVAAMRAGYPREPLRVWAKRFGIRISTAHAAITGKTWAWL